MRLFEEDTLYEKRDYHVLLEVDTMFINTKNDDRQFLYFNYASINKEKSWVCSYRWFNFRGNCCFSGCEVSAIIIVQASLSNITW